MNIRITLYVFGGLLLFLGGMLLVPLPFALYYGDGQVDCFLLSASITIAAGAALNRCFCCRDEVTLREGFAIVNFAWIGFALFGALPYMFSGSLLHPVDAYFEAMSGFSTTGASVFAELEDIPQSVHLWRALTQWLGGMGFIVLSVAILPLLGVGGMQLFEAEAPGPTTDRLKPRIQDTARLLWAVYAIVTAVGVILLWLGPMNFFDALCHTFTALATGGFSTRNASLGAFGTYSQLVTIALMAIGGANFSLHYHALRGRPGNYWKSDEFRFYVQLLAGISLIVFFFNWSAYRNPLVNLRDSVFTVTSILTTTGFVTADFEGWPVFSQAALYTLMFVGGCAGSTAGGLKHVRLLLLVKHALLQTSRLIHPRRVHVLKLDQRPVSAETMQDMLGFTVLFVAIYVAATLILTALGVDLVTAGSASVASLGTIGPGLGNVGPTDNYAALPYSAKFVLSFVMLLGRLEVSTVLVLFFLSFWKK